VLGALTLALVITGCAAGRPGPEQQLEARAAYERGSSYVRENKLTLALTALQQAVKLDEQEPLYHNGLGILYLHYLRRPDLALTEFQRAAALDSNNADAQYNMGIALAEMGMWADAIPAYQRAIALPTLATPQLAHNALGLAFYQVKRYREAEEALRFAISLEPKLEGAYYNLGLVFIAQDRKEEARIAFRQARTLAPESPFGQAALERLKALGDGG